MGRANASEYYNDNLKRLLHEEVGRIDPPQGRSRYDGQAYTGDVRRRDNVRPPEKGYRPVRTIYQTDAQYRRDDRRIARPQVPVYDSGSYGIGERDERRGKIEGVYGRRDTGAGVPSSYDRVDHAAPIGGEGHAPVYRPRSVDNSQPQPVPRHRPQNAAQSQRQVLSQPTPRTQVRPQPQPQPQLRTQPQLQPQPQSRTQSQPQRIAPRSRPERMRTNPGGGMSYDARYGGEINPTSAVGDSRQDASAKPNGKEKVVGRKAARKEKDRLDPEIEAEVRENRRLYKEYIDNERMTMDRVERDRRRMEEYYAARSGKFARKLRELFILTAAFAVTLGLICVIVYKFLFVVSEVKVYGESAVSGADIIAASGVENGDNLYSFGASAVSSAVTLRYPIIKSVTVKRTIPNKVAFTVTDDKPVFYSDIYGELRMLSADLRVMGVKDGSREGLIKLKLPSLEYAVDGRGVRYADGKQNRYVMDIIGMLLASPLAERMTMVDLTHSYDVKMVCDGKYLLNFGESEEMDIKMKLAAAVLNDDLFSGGNKATVDLSDTSQTSVIVDNQLVLD